MINFSLLILAQSNIFLERELNIWVLMRMSSIVFKKTMTSSLASGLNVAVYSFSRFISLVINSLEHLNHSHVAVPFYNILKITSY